MGIIEGVVLFLVGVCLFFLGKPRSSGEYFIPLMRVWFLGQLYAMVVLVAFVMGATLIISNWPL